MSTSVSRNIIGFFVATAAAISSSLALLVAENAAHKVPALELSTFLLSVGLLTLLALVWASVIGIPTVVFLKRRRWMALRDFLYTGIVVAIPLGMGWVWLMKKAESSPVTFEIYFWGFALGLTMAVPAYIAYWYVAGRKAI